MLEVLKMTLDDVSKANYPRLNFILGPPKNLWSHEKETIRTYQAILFQRIASLDGKLLGLLDLMDKFTSVVFKSEKNTWAGQHGWTKIKIIIPSTLSLLKWWAANVCTKWIILCISGALNKSCICHHCIWSGNDRWTDDGRGYKWHEKRLKSGSPWTPLISSAQ